MKKFIKKSQLLVLIVVLSCLTSCVYSLFPIYTEDTLVFKPELLGKWQTKHDIARDKENYILLERFSERPKKDEGKYDYSIEEFIIKSDKLITITPKNGSEISGIEEVRKHIEEMINRSVGVDNMKSADYNSSAKSVLEVKAILKHLNVRVYPLKNKSFKLTAVNDGKKDNEYLVHLVKIGDGIFMDLYPIMNQDKVKFGDNLFPVHSFLKVELKENELIMAHFDLDKLNKLFESNLIRLRHENVDGTILITARPEELQKFLEKYSQNESVYKSTSTYSKIAS